MESRYEERIKDCKTEEELAQYLLMCVPVIREYTGITETTTSTKKVANLNIASKKGVQRNDIYKRYLREVEDDDGETCRNEEDEFQPCKGCGKMFTKIHDEQQSDLVCVECGYTEYFLSEELGFKDEQEVEKNIVYSYKRENHFNEWISQFQAKESTSVPDEVINQLRTEFRKMKIKTLDEITHEKVRSLLKKLDKNKYYEHAPYIATILGGVTPPTMTQELEDKLRLMFHKIQAPFEKHKPSQRKNFLSYSYVLYKMCELLGEDQYLPCFPLLKSKEKLYIQDQIWRKICEELEWEFIRTI
jgi:predicted nucleic-acid-binding Zn-ribbon protein